ncbi:MAG: [FeFe] hydrogenase H-cluster radical SAM maturase HydG [Bacteroidetes bacterium]|nr:[FeFe] hydrogenase H-cluster radical SAM maturase HydG [Bacteroidota bacterium]
MKFTPEKCRIPDERMKPFIDPEEIWDLINNTKSTPERVRELIAKSLSKQRLTMEETAVLLNTTEPSLIEEIKEGARELKRLVYGNRIVLFAPLYVGNKCINNCQYCGFRSTNKEQIRTTLTDQELIDEVEALEETGQKRLILVYGEHHHYSPEFIAHNVKLVYDVKKNHGEIRRVNINAAPLEIEGFKTVKAAGIGTYQIFQETYNPEAYKIYHLGGKKMDFEYRLTSLDRAQEGGIDDVGIGALIGLYDWRFEVLGLIRHTNHLEACYNVGPHTISFPRIKDASELNINGKYMVNDKDFARLVAILRLAVPYTGMILTARETPALRKEVLQFGISQIDGGTKLEIGAYAETENEDQNLHREQFAINDSRSLNEIMDELIATGFMPSFCTACYRLGRTGEHFMEFSVPGFIKRFCTPNAILTLSEYLVDYAPVETAEKGWLLIEKELQALQTTAEKINVTEIRNRIEQIKAGKRDLYF